MKNWLIIGSVLIGLSVILGAFATHTLKDKLSLQDLNIFETGVRYQTYHSFGLILLGLIGFFFPSA